MTVLWKMQRCLKFQSQSKILEKKVLFIIFSVVLISISPQVFGEDELDALLEKENGVLIEQQKIIFEMGRHSDVHVKHVIETGAWNPDRPRIIEILPGMHSNLTIVDEDGDTYGVGYDGDTFEESKYIILRQKLGNYDLIAGYDLKNFMELENGLWKKNIHSTNDILVMFEEDMELIFANSRPVDIREAKGINCIGCGITIEYFENNDTIKKEILFVEQKYEIEVSANEEISEFKFFGGGSNILNFDVTDVDQLFVLKIPLELFKNPFDVYLTEKDDMELDQLDKIRKTEFAQDETHVSLSFRTNSEGTISVLGATPEEHQAKLDQIEWMKENAVASTKIEEKKGVALPIPGTKAASELAEKMSDTNDGEETTLSFADELKQGQRQDSGDDMTIIVIISGIIVAIIIGGALLKLKKNK